MSDLSMPDRETAAVHAEPIWRHRADFIFHAPVASFDRAEQLWARKRADGMFELCCIPFFLYDVFLGDVVDVDDGWIRRVVTPSGRRSLRVYFGDAMDQRGRVERALGELGGLIEWSSATMLAVDAEGWSAVNAMREYLDGEQPRGLIYETGWT